jgi:hypothetical protein
VFALGLDLFHVHAKHEADEKFCRVGNFFDELTPLRSYFQEHDNPHINWEKMFAERGLVYRDYRVMSRAFDGKCTCFFFVDADAAGFQHPIRAVFSDESRFPLLPKFMKRSKFDMPAARKAPHFFGPFEMVMKTETVIFYDVAGYQRNGVSDEFYHHFRPDEVTCLEHRVYAIYQSTIPEAREDFKRKFLDNWIEGRSFVLISY